ncbi:outer membrane beta-barrel protein [Tenacibaculum maritimum]|uniref:Putative Secreted protein n=2 Tax=Tenacibaculum maritimum TaxID=107401 RepID=A0A2H1E925_9FLAO|nr:outer membrane beta-barrel protein [Tenacibaculum maritimum]MCD9563961.1 outer membrane beta-barrel protein [Tenacibaculum maritimum]MCD9565419.1 outer membrane beta-barrel protein [Tenacibaculum maritimum]MCD9579241.1 outer membrane beta-barrel protein [Tenacibaculum maritimum]MCD9582459.1 outer membrane beta-barrel protein [Tenacibaculum maritimum]MCD9584293.1 outer membrane beta-barrel protein [Tenacibaculum maritimum]
MRKIILLILVFFSMISYGQERKFNIGIHGGLTIGDVKNKSSIGFGGDINYLFDLSEELFIGPSLSLLYFSPKDKNDALLYLPLGGAIRYNNLEDPFFVGMDLGYAIGVSPSGDRGGLLFKPMVGYNLSDNFQLSLSYIGVKKEKNTYSYIALGVSFDIFGGSDYYMY